MQCGHCGTEVNDGFTTCPSCGATYRMDHEAIKRGLGISLGAVIAYFLLPEIFSVSTMIALVVAGFMAAIAAVSFLQASKRRWWRRTN